MAQVDTVKGLGFVMGAAVDNSAADEVFNATSANRGGEGDDLGNLVRVFPKLSLSVGTEPVESTVLVKVELVDELSGVRDLLAGDRRLNSAVHRLGNSGSGLAKRSLSWHLSKSLHGATLRSSRVQRAIEAGTWLISESLGFSDSRLGTFPLCCESSLRSLVVEPSVVGFVSVLLVLSLCVNVLLLTEGGVSASSITPGTNSHSFVFKFLLVHVVSHDTSLQVGVRGDILVERLLLLLGQVSLC